MPAAAVKKKPKPAPPAPPKPTKPKAARGKPKPAPATTAASLGLPVRRVPADSLKLDPKNARQHSPKNLAAIKASLVDFGQRLPLVVWKGVVIGGNATLTVMRELGWTEVDVSEFEGTESQARKLKIALNRTGELATWDYQILADDLSNILEDLGGDFDMMATLGWDKHEIEPLLEATWSPKPTSDEDFPTGNPQEGGGVTLKLTADEAEVFEEAVAQVREGTDDGDELTKGQVLVILCREYMKR